MIMFAFEYICIYNVTCYCTLFSVTSKHTAALAICTHNCDGDSLELKLLANANNFAD